MFDKSLYIYKIGILIQKLKGQVTNYKLVLNEVGAGMPVYSKLALYRGISSNFVLTAESNNDIEFTKKYNNIDDSLRLVSEEVSKILAKNTFTRARKYYKENNLISISNTVQLSTDNNVISHGYFTFINSDKKVYTYHYTLPDDVRATQIDLIGYIGLDILCHHLCGTKMCNGFIDYTNEGLKKLININLNKDSYSKTMNHNTSFIVDNGVVKRTDDVLRNSNGEDIMIFKGSFNPITPTHIDIFNNINVKKENKYFCISLVHREDKDITEQSIINRIKVLNKLGYKVIIDTIPYFNDIYNVIRYSPTYKGQKIYFPLGEDVWNRLYLDVDSQNKCKYTKTKHLFRIIFKNAEFILFNRNNRLDTHKVPNAKTLIINHDINMSSTNIRALLKDKNYKELYNIYKEHLSINEFKYFIKNNRD